MTNSQTTFTVPLLELQGPALQLHLQIFENIIICTLLDSRPQFAKIGAVTFDNRAVLGPSSVPLLLSSCIKDQLPYALRAKQFMLQIAFNEPLIRKDIGIRYDDTQENETELEENDVERIREIAIACNNAIIAIPAIQAKYTNQLGTERIH